jgi:hypothetical protein
LAFASQRAKIESLSVDVHNQGTNRRLGGVVALCLSFHARVEPTP